MLSKHTWLLLWLTGQVVLVRTGLGYAQAQKTDTLFFARPYLQIGRTPSPETIQLLWHAPESSTDWSVEYRVGAGAPWKKTASPTSVRVAVAGIEPHRVYDASLTGLTPGGASAIGC